MTIQAYGPGPASAAILCLDDISRRFDEPRVYDFTLARALGFEHARNIRRLIKSNRVELESHGELVRVEDRTGGTGYLLRDGAIPRAGRPGVAFYLNEAQALVICAVTRTSIAAHVRGEIIKVFMLWRAGRLHEVPTNRRLVPAERRALRQILENADVVLAPRCVRYGRNDAGELHLAAEPFNEDSAVPYLLAPITFGILDTLSEFEAHDGREPDDDAEVVCEDEGAQFDGEPSLGSINPDPDLSQVQWGIGNAGGDDLELAVEANLGRRRSRPREDYLDGRGYFMGENAVAKAQAARRIREIVGAPQSNLRPVI